MRCSEAVKKHSLETKERILRNVFAAAEEQKEQKENTFGIIGTAVGTEQETENKEKITMKKTTNRFETAEVRSRKSGIIAAACALVMLGGGAFALNSANNDRIVSSPMTAPSETTVSAASPAENSEAPAPEVKPDTEKQYTFDELFDMSDLVCDGRFFDDEDLCLTADGFKPAAECKDLPESEILGKFICHKADVPSFLYFNRMSSADKDYCDHGENIVLIYEPVSDFDAPDAYHFTDGMSAFVMIKKNEFGTFSFTSPTSAFTFDNESFRFEDKNGMGSYTDSINTLIRYRFEKKNYGELTKFYECFGIPYAIADVQADGYDKDAVVSINPNDTDELRAYIITINTPEEETDLGVEMTEEEAEHRFDYYLDLERKTLPLADKGKITEGFDGLDMEMTELFYIPEENAVGFEITVKTKDGSPLPYAEMDNAFKDVTLSYSSGAEELMYLVNADAFMGYPAITEHGVNNTMKFVGLADLAENDYPISADKDKTITIKVDSIDYKDVPDITGEFSADVKIDLSGVTGNAQ